MSRTSTVFGNTHLVVDTGVAQPPAVTIVERKGLGHPDTLADHLAEELSRAYSRYTVERFGAVLHHNFDKLALLGGASEVRYGAGRMTSPVKVLVNGRAAPACGGERIPVEEIVKEGARSFFAARLPEVSDHLEITFNITSNSSPGAVLTGDDVPDRTRWFNPRSIEDLRERRVRLSNDTSLGTGWAPENVFESFVRELVDHFSGESEFTRSHPWCGSDVKLMGYWDSEQADIVLCVPQKSRFVASRTEYVRNTKAVLDECYRLASLRLPGAGTRFRLNARDVPEKDELYLTYTGSSIESGDEGVVGRGNRVNGLITPLRPMNLEGANGKNPVYHVGKLYNIAARRLAQRLHEATGGHAEVHLVSTTGQRLDQPWRVLVRLSSPDAEVEKVQALVAETMDAFPAMTDELVSDGIVLS